MSPIKRLLRRIPALRWCALRYTKDIRQRRRDIAWNDTQSVLTAIGNITIAWAGINLILNRFIEADRAERGPMFEDHLPKAFTRKLDYLEKVEGDPRWAPDRITIFKTFRPELAELNTYRVDLVHGLLTRNGYAPEWTIHVAKESKDKLARRTVAQTSDDIHAFAQRLSDMGERLSAFFMPMLGKQS